MQPVTRGSPHFVPDRGCPRSTEISLVGIISMMFAVS